MMEEGSHNTPDGRRVLRSPKRLMEEQTSGSRSASESLTTSDGGGGHEQLVYSRAELVLSGTTSYPDLVVTNWWNDAIFQ